MSVYFTGSGNQILQNSVPPIKDYPFTVGFYAYPLSTNQVTVWGLADAASNASLFQVFKNVNGWNLQVIGVGGNNLCVTGPLSVDWHFVVARCISATNRRISVLGPQGTLLHASTTTSIAPTPANITKIELGGNATASGFYDGLIQDYFFVNGDIQQDHAQLNNDFMLTLARRGPFHFPHIVANLVEYRSFRKTALSDRDTIGDSWWGTLARGRQTWTTASIPRLTIHTAKQAWDEPARLRKPIIPVRLLLGGGSSAKFRRTLSHVGTRVGSRQVHIG